MWGFEKFCEIADIFHKNFVKISDILLAVVLRTESQKSKGKSRNHLGGYFSHSYVREIGWFPNCLPFLLDTQLDYISQCPLELMWLWLGSKSNTCPYCVWPIK